ncbi:hypothetical protein Tco_1215661 [Tanacetum coccineum]
MAQTITGGSGSANSEELLPPDVHGSPAEGRGYAGNLPWCNRCKAHHQPGSCPPKCGKCHIVGHQEGIVETRIPVARDNSLQNVTCFGCGNHGHFRVMPG